MRIQSLVLCLAACGGGDDPVQPDAARDIDAPPPEPKSCKTFGPLVRKGVVARVGGLPVSTSGVESDPWIERDDDRLRMWFTTASRTPPHAVRIAYAESDDGMTWMNVDDGVVRPTAGTFDGIGVETAAIARIGDGFKMFYTADAPPDGSIRFSIGAARSPDGTTWIKDGNAFPPDLPWERPFCDGEGCPRRIGGTLEPSLLVEGEKLRMWYAALGAIGDFPSYRIGHAVSSDGGSTWTRNAEPVFVAAALGSWDEVLVSHTNVVADPGGGYHLFYFGSSLADHTRCEQAGGCMITPGAIGHAYSTDGITWVRDPKNPILTSEQGAFDAWSVGGPMALIEDGELRLWYFGTPSATSIDLRIGYASAPCD